LSEFSKDFDTYLRSRLTQKQIAELKDEILKEWKQFKKERKKLKEELLYGTEDNSEGQISLP